MPSSVYSGKHSKQELENRKYTSNHDRQGTSSNTPLSVPVFPLYVGGLPSELSSNALKNMFSAYGHVLKARILLPKKEGSDSCAGFIDYSSFEDAENAIKNLNGFKFGKKTLKVCHANSRRKVEDNFTTLLNKLESGPVVDHELKSLMQKSGNEFPKTSVDGEWGTQGSHVKRKVLLKTPPQSQYIAPAETFIHANKKRDFKQKSSLQTEQTFHNKPYFQKSPNSSEFTQKPFNGKYRSSENTKKTLNQVSICNKASNNQGSSFENCQRPISRNQKCLEKNRRPLNKMQMLSQHNQGSKPTVPNHLSSKITEETDKKACQICNTPTTKVCGSCSITRYCSQDCQKEDWKSHQLSCIGNIKVSSNQKHGSGNASTKNTIALISEDITVGVEFEVLVIDINSELGVLICHKNDKKSFAQLNSSQISLNKHFLSSTHSPLASPAVGDACACLFSDDNQFYRAIVKDVYADKKAIVHYIDYGNIEEVELDNLMHLDDSFCKQPAFSMQCKLAGCDENSSWSEDQLKYLSKILHENDAVLNASVIKISDEYVFLELKIADLSVNAKMRAFSLIKSQNDLSFDKNDKTLSSNKQKEMCSELSLQPEHFPQGQFPVVISYVEDPSCFYCQIVNDDLVKLHEGLDNLSNHIVSNQTAFTPVVGGYCSAVYAEDSSWCRGKVLEAITADLYLVQYIDFGNAAKVSIDEMQPLPKEFCFPFQTFKFGLADCCPFSGQSWSNDATLFMKNLENSSCMVEVKGNVDDRFDVILFTQDKDISLNECLISSKFCCKSEEAVELSVVSALSSFDEEISQEMVESVDNVQQDLTANTPPMNEIVQIAITSVSEQGMFYCHLAHADLLKLAQMVENLTTHCNSDKAQALENVLPGMYCAAYYAREDLWNRALVLPLAEEDQNESVYVRFVDYGNSESVNSNNIRTLPLEYKSLPMQGIPCSVVDVKPCDGSKWTEEMNIELTSCMKVMPIEAKFVAKTGGVYLTKLPYLVNSLIKKELAKYTF